MPDLLSVTPKTYSTIIPKGIVMYLKKSTYPNGFAIFIIQKLMLDLLSTASKTEKIIFIRIVQNLNKTNHPNGSAILFSTKLMLDVAELPLTLMTTGS